MRVRYAVAYCTPQHRPKFPQHRTFAMVMHMHMAEVSVSHDECGKGGGVFSHPLALACNANGSQRPRKLSYAHLINPEPRRLAYILVVAPCPQALRPSFALFIHLLSWFILDVQLVCELQLCFVS